VQLDLFVVIEQEKLSQLAKNPKPSSEAARNRMRAVKRRDTEAEMKVRRLLFAMGLRYRVDYEVIEEPRRRADIVFKKAKVAVFIDGCFWHACPLHGSSSKANAKFWKDKIETNVERDKDTTRRLKEKGWLVIRAWEHEDPQKVTNKIASQVGKRTK